MVFSNPAFRDYIVDKTTDPFDTVEDAFIFAADVRSSGQEIFFEFGKYTFNQSIDVDIRLREEFGWHPTAATAASGILAAAGFAPLVFYTWAPYTNPYTAGPAFALDAYNVYRYFDD